MSLKQNEVAINKAVSVKLDDETIAIVAYVYHTRNKELEGDQSFYRTEVRVAKIADIEAEIEQMKLPENRTKAWKWPNKAWPAEWFMSYNMYSDQAGGAKFLKMKLKKALDWQRFEALVKDGLKTLGNGQKKSYVGAAYEHEGFEDESGNEGLSILNPSILLQHLDKPMWKMHEMKRMQK